jgi:hypothetical protein
MKPTDDMEEDDIKREPFLRALFAHEVVEVTTHPTEGVIDVAAAYATDPAAPDRKLFLCILHRGAADKPDGFWMQFVEGTALDNASVTTALGVWAARVFPELKAPSFLVRAYDDDWRAGWIPSSEVWAIREALSLVSDRESGRMLMVDPEAGETPRRAMIEHMINKCEKQSVPVERCRRLLDILDLDDQWTVERLERYRPAT